jgi:fluoroquinolone transport system permease protein
MPRTTGGSVRRRGAVSNDAGDGMSRLAASLLLDTRLQGRNKLYHIGIALAIGLGVAGRSFFEREALGLVLPVFYLLFLGGTTYMFGASMLILERGERTLDAARVTPLRVSEYIASKVATLSAFALLESLIILFLALGATGFDLPLLIVGIVVMGVFYTLLGVAQVAPYDSVTDFLVPGAMVVMILLQLPLFHVIGVWPSPFWYIVPTLAPLVLMEGAFRPLATWEWIYALGYSALSITAAYRFARVRFAAHLGMSR